MTLQEERDAHHGSHLGGQEAHTGREKGPAVPVAEAAFFLHGADTVPHLVVHCRNVENHPHSQRQTCKSNSVAAVNKPCKSYGHLSCHKQSETRMAASVLKRTYPVASGVC